MARNPFRDWLTSDLSDCLQIISFPPEHNIVSAFTRVWCQRTMAAVWILFLGLSLAAYDVFVVICCSDVLIFLIQSDTRSLKWRPALPWTRLFDHYYLALCIVSWKMLKIHFLKTKRPVLLVTKHYNMSRDCVFFCLPRSSPNMAFNRDCTLIFRNPLPCEPLPISWGWSAHHWKMSSDSSCVCEPQQEGNRSAATT